MHTNPEFVYVKNKKLQEKPQKKNIDRVLSGNNKVNPEFMMYPFIKAQRQKLSKYFIDYLKENFHIKKITGHKCLEKIWR